MINKSTAFGLLAGLLLGIAAEPVLAQQAVSRETPVVKAFQKNKDAVVSIATKQTAQHENDLFNMRLEDLFPFQPRRQYTLSSLGSGFIINPRGYIITNAHVVDRAEEITVIMPDDAGTSYPAHKIAVDTSIDLAVIKIDANQPMPTVSLGVSDDVMIGETVLAIGNPYGFRQTLTDGIVSAIHRDLQISEEYTLPEMIQISAPINFGNSGGPLININGDVIGINTAIRKAAQNIGFAIPIDRLSEKLPNLLNIDNIRRTNLGLEVDQRQLNAPHIDAGKQSAYVVIRSVGPNSAAHKADLQIGDIITAIDGHSLHSLFDFYLYLIEVEAGKEIQFELVRPDSLEVISPHAGKAFSKTITLQQRPKPDGGVLAQQLFGIKLEPLTEAIIRQYSLAGRPGQLVVTEVQSKSPADQAGVKAGDVLAGLGDEEIASLDQLGLILENVKPDQTVNASFSRTRKRGFFSEIVQFTRPLRARSISEAPESTSGHMQL